jgi:hypothetical protein
MRQLKRMVRAAGRPLLVIAFCLGLAACESSELRPVPVGLPSGGVPAAPTAPQAPAAPMAPPVMAYTEDPEAETEDWEEYIWADNEQQARRNCQQLAERFTEQGRGLVTLVGVQKLGKRGSRWVCRFRG